MKPRLDSTFWQRAFLAFTVGMFLSCAAKSSFGQTVDRAAPPPAGPAAPLHLPRIVLRHLDNGARVAVLERHDIPVVAIRVINDAGALQDPAGKEGLASITFQMLGEGTTTRTADQLAEAFADLGTRVSPGGFTTVDRNVDASLALMADQLLHPAFPQASLDRIEANRAAELQRLRDQPGYIAGRVLASALYGTHPYARASTDSSIRAITRDDVARFHDRYYGPQNIAFVVAGDITPDSAVAALQRVFGRAVWPSGGTAVGRSAIAPPTPPARTTIDLYDRPGSPQSVIAVAQLGPRRDTPDYYALDLLNTVLGGAFSSRLNQNLRERHGWTYGAGSGFAYRRVPQVGQFSASSAVVAAKTDSALIEMMRVLRDIRTTRPVTDSELAFAKSSATRGLPLAFETIDEDAGAGAEVLRDGLPLDYYDHLTSRFRAVTAADVRRAAERHLDPAHMAIVVVGDRKVVEPGLRASGIGPVVVVDEHARPVADAARP